VSADPKPPDVPYPCLRRCGRARRPMPEVRAFIGQGAEQLQDPALRAHLTTAAFEMWGACLECARGLSVQLLTAGHFVGDDVALGALPGMLAPSAPVSVWLVHTKGGDIPLCGGCIARLYCGGRLFEDDEEGALTVSDVGRLRRYGDEAPACLACEAMEPKKGGAHA
jgi:hypothetical protein